MGMRELSPFCIGVSMKVRSKLTDEVSEVIEIFEINDEPYFLVALASNNFTKIRFTECTLVREPVMTFSNDEEQKILPKCSVPGCTYTAVGGTFQNGRFINICPFHIHRNQEP
jgi:hypothetical protein